VHNKRCESEGGPSPLTNPLTFTRAAAARDDARATPKNILPSSPYNPHMTTTRALPAPRLVLIAALGITAICFAIVHSRLFAMNPDVAAWGVTFDLMVTIPALYYIALVRRGRASLASMIPLFAVCGLAARQIVPGANQQFLHQLGLAISAPLELFAVGWLVLRARNAKRMLGGGDAIDRLRAAALELTRNAVVAEVVVGEVIVWYYALFSWRRKPDVREGQTAVTVHEQSGWGAVLVALFIVMAGEAFGMHLVVQRWSTIGAWVLTGLEAYGMLWFIADLRALKLRPTVVDAAAIRIRFGLRWNAVIPRSAVLSVDRITGPTEKRPGLLKVAIITDPTYLITLREPVTATSMFGIRREIRELALAPDDAAALEKALGS
jgi:membrane protein YdbS with pleckstrin-like domain